jgi:PIN domain nuclease of toxin-antitoxin system
VRLLLDTHAFLWATGEPSRLSPRVRKFVQEPKHEIFVSVAACWEIVIKHALGKLTLPMLPNSWLPSRIAALGLKTLPITLDHVIALESLPAIHDDPFDRVMVAQAAVEGLTLATRDTRILRYPVRTMRA